LTTNEHLHAFLGYDEKQDLAWEVCAESIRQSASRPVSIHKLDHRMLRDLGLFDREWVVEGKTGRYKDTGDGKPASTQFSHSRFLVPALVKHLGINQAHNALFVDSDFVFLDDPYELLWECGLTEGNHTQFPVHVVKHEYNPDKGLKMDGQVQVPYAMKLWSSLMVFNLRDPRIYDLTANKVNTMTGRDLHQFQWLNPKKDPLWNSDNFLGRISERWNFIPDHSEPRVPEKDIGAVHWTEGIPSIPGYSNCKYADMWNDVCRKVYRTKLKMDFYE